MVNLSKILNRKYFRNLHLPFIKIEEKEAKFPKKNTQTNSKQRGQSKQIELSLGPVYGKCSKNISDSTRKQLGT